MFHERATSHGLYLTTNSSFHCLYIFEIKTYFRVFGLVVLKLLHCALATKAATSYLCCLYVFSCKVRLLKLSTEGRIFTGHQHSLLCRAVY